MSLICVCETLYPKHLHQPMQQIHNNISKNKTLSLDIYTNRTLLVSTLESTKAVSTVAYRLGLHGHVTHLQLPLEMHHTTKIKTVPD